MIRKEERQNWRWNEFSADSNPGRQDMTLPFNHLSHLYQSTTTSTFFSTQEIKILFSKCKLRKVEARMNYLSPKPRRMRIKVAFKKCRLLEGAQLEPRARADLFSRLVPWSLRMDEIWNHFSSRPFSSASSSSISIGWAGGMIFRVGGTLLKIGYFWLLI